MKSPFESARRRSTVAENVLITAVLEDGTTGYGEASPAGYVTGESPADVLRAAATVDRHLRSVEVEETANWSRTLNDVPGAGHTLISAVEMALLDALTQCWRIPLCVYFGGGGRSVRSDLTVPISTAERAGELAAGAAASGFRSLKIKVGGADREADFQRALAVQRAAPTAAVRLDANQGFAAEEALQFLDRCLQAGIRVEMMEQPVPREDLAALEHVTARSPVPVLADEAVVTPRDAVTIAAQGAAHGINIKVAKAGLIGALQIIAIARAAGLKLMLGCMLESTLGIGASLHLAAGTGAFEFLDLDSHLLIGEKPDGNPFHQAGDVLTVAENRMGLGWRP